MFYFNEICFIRPRRTDLTTFHVLGIFTDTPFTNFVNTKVSVIVLVNNGPGHSKPYKMSKADSEDSDQPEYPRNLIRIYTVRVQKMCVLVNPPNALRRL